MNMTSSVSSLRKNGLSVRHRITALIMAPLTVISGWPVLAQNSSPSPSVNTDSSAHSTASVTPVKLESAKSSRAANRPYTAPAQEFTKAVLPTLPDNPSDADLEQTVILSRALYPTNSHYTAAENRELAQALHLFARTGAAAEDESALKGFLDAHPDSRWALGLYDNLGHYYYSRGYFSKALDAWEKAWKLGKNVVAGDAQILADDSVSQLAKMNARIGRVSRLESLFSGIGNRTFSGHAAELMTGAHEGLWLMKNDPANAFRCGPMALGTVSTMVKSNGKKTARVDIAVDDFKSSSRGTSLADVAAHAAKIGLSYQAAKRTVGSDVLYPSVINWKVGHYAAVVGKTANGYLVHDPTFGENLVVSKKAIDEESSGYFLVKAGKLPSGWSSVSEKEAGNVWGKGNTGSSNPNPTTPCDKKVGGNQTGCNCQCKGMAGYSVHAMLVSLNIVDTPLWYNSAYGQPLNFTMTYNQRDPEDPTQGIPYGGFGNRWANNWISFVEYNPSLGVSSDNSPKVYAPGGGFLQFDFPNATATTDGNGNTIYVPSTASNGNRMTQAVLHRSASGVGGYSETFPDGSSALYGYSDGSGSSSSIGRVYLTQYTDAQGNSTTYTYSTTTSGIIQLVSATDATGQQALFTYSNSNAKLITKIQLVGDGRHADFTYDANGRLASITDMGGITSSFTYLSSSSSFINTLTTPYGTTHFSYGDASLDGSGVGRWIEATDPLGATERTEYQHYAPGIADSDPVATVPPNSGNLVTTNQYLEFRNTYFWSKKAYSMAKGDYTKAQIYHWLHSESGQTDCILESTKAPLENRVWYCYPDQVSSIDVGSSDKATAIGRMVEAADGSLVPQIYNYTYDDFGNVTQSTDPVGRVTQYNYTSDPNAPMILSVKQQVNGGALEMLASYNYNHPAGITAVNKNLPYQITDTAGQTKTFTYTTLGQMASVSVVRNGTTETTLYAHGSTSGQASYNRLTDIFGPGSILLQHITYDSAGRQASVQDVSGYTLSYTYDSLDRIVLVTYPDATAVQMIYPDPSQGAGTVLNIQWNKDRMGRWTHYYYDPLQRLTQVDDPAGHSVHYDYCPCGALEGIVDGEGHKTSFIYDLQTRLTNKVYADGKQMIYEYEKNSDGSGVSSRLRKVTDAKNQVTNYSYNVDNTIAAISYTNAVFTTPSISYAYDPYYKRLTNMVDGTGTTSYGYYAVGSLGGGRLYTVDGPLTNDTVSYVYDELGRVLNSAVNGVADNVTYDTLGRVSSETNVLSTTPFSFYYVGNTDMVDHINYPNGQVTSYSYYGVTGDNQLSEIWNKAVGGTGTLSKFDYAYNAVGDIITWTQQLGSAAAVDHEYSYDGADELLDETQSEHTSGMVQQQTSWDYDKAGNRTKEQVGTVLSGANYNNLNQLTSRNGTGALTVAGIVSEPAIVTVGGNNASVDANNHFRATVTASPGPTSIPITTVDKSGNSNTSTYHANVTVTAGMVSSTSFLYDDNGNMTQDDIGRTYEWDAMNRLIAINFPAVNGVVHRSEFTYNGIGQRVRVTEKSSGSIDSDHWYVWDGAELKEERDSNNQNTTKRFYGDGEQIGTSSYFYTFDHLGSIREMTDVSGVVQAQYSYDSWGRKNKINGSIDADFGFTGHYLHAASGLWLTYYRAYSSDYGKWLSRDPLGEGGGLNIYSYAANQPLLYIDDLGLQLSLAPGAAGLAEAGESAEEIAETLGISIQAALSAVIAARAGQLVSQFASQAAQKGGDPCTQAKLALKMAQDSLKSTKSSLQEHMDQLNNLAGEYPNVTDPRHLAGLRDFKIKEIKNMETQISALESATEKLQKAVDEACKCSKWNPFNWF